MRSRISRRLLHPLVLCLLAAVLAASALPAYGKGGFCPGLCGERFQSEESFESVVYE